MNGGTVNAEDLMKLTNDELHISAVRTARNERMESVKVIMHLREVNRRGLHLEKGFKSLQDYAAKALGYSSSSAYRRSAAAEVIAALPVKDQSETLKAIETSKTNLTALVSAKSFFYQEKKSNVVYSASERAEVLKSIESKNQYEVQKELVTKAKGDHVNVAPPKAEIKPVRGGRIKIEFMADESLKDKLDRIKNLIAHRNPNPTMEELLEIMSEIVLKKIDPSLHVKREMPKEKKELVTPSVFGAKTQSSTSNGSTPKSRSYKKAALHALWTRAQVDTKPQCEYTSPGGQRCTSHYGLEIEHIQPFSRGGTNELSNLKLFCRAHNAFAWKKWKAAEQTDFVLQQPL